KRGRIRFLSAVCSSALHLHHGWIPCLPSSGPGHQRFRWLHPRRLRLWSWLRWPRIWWLRVRRPWLRRPWLRRPWLRRP
ncbi:unnamed protein product, partial [Ixodes pacificus]